MIWIYESARSKACPGSLFIFCTPNWALPESVERAHQGEGKHPVPHIVCVLGRLHEPSWVKCTGFDQ